MRTSRVMVTIIDPFTFESEWVVKENAWAEKYGRPIITLFDGDLCSIVQPPNSPSAHVTAYAPDPRPPAIRIITLPVP